ncbi:MDR family MFS transporter [Actinoalloteichus caeruleus]|uniref:MDR family MFS transporter n=1 Tax=Actinoalloteichus cyanogriseus TaxID=2893586 RepID=UPI0004AB03BB|nr:MDR family MFS transporter [Actinoalloteichus caeruleus]
MADTARPATSPRPGHQYDHRQVLRVLSGLLIGMFLSALDQTVVATAMRTIADELHGQTIQAWATTAYLVTATVATPLYGKLSDLYGRRPVYLAAIGIFLLGSLLCGLAASMPQLAAFRAVQGLGGGGLFSLAFVIVSDLVPPRERGRYQAYFMAVFGSASLLGPVVGGLFAGAPDFLGLAGWRWIFLINVPIGIVAVLVVHRVLDLPVPGGGGRVDYLGAVALVVAVVPLLTVASHGREWGWGSPTSVLLYLVAGFGLLAFVLVERRSRDVALLPPHLFRIRTFVLGNVLNVLVGMAMFGSLAVLPLYLQIVRGHSAMVAGLLLLPQTLGNVVATIIVGHLITATGRVRRFAVFGSATSALALALLSTVRTDTPLALVGLHALLLGVGVGVAMQTLTLIVQIGAPRADLGSATSSSHFFRQIGGSAGTAVLLSVLFGLVGGRLDDSFAAARADPDFARHLTEPAVTGDPDNRPVLDAVTEDGRLLLDLDNTEFLATVDPVLAAPVLAAFASAAATAFLVGAVAAVLAFLVALLVPDARLAGREDPPTTPVAGVDAATDPVTPETEVAGRPDDQASTRERP